MFTVELFEETEHVLAGEEGSILRPRHHLDEPGGSVRGERANLRGLVLGCIEAEFCNQMPLKYSRRDLHDALLCSAFRS